MIEGSSKIVKHVNFRIHQDKKDAKKAKCSHIIKEKPKLLRPCSVCIS
jgi:hypothetical protein